MIRSATDFIDAIGEAAPELDDDTPLIFIQLEQHTLLVKEVVPVKGNLVIIAGGSAGEFGG